MSKRITELTELTAVANDDELVIVDKSASNVNKKITKLNLVKVDGATTDNIATFDANDLPKDSGKALPSGSIVGTTDTQTLTNKRLTSPKINEDVVMTATATELNTLDGITADVNELNLNDGSVAGTAVASKTLALGANKNVDLLTIDNAIKFNTPDSFLINGKITPTVSSSNLTLAIKTYSGSDPSSSSPVYVKINGTIYSITSATSFTLNAGTSYFGSGAADLATYEIDYFVYLGYRVSDTSVFIGASRISFGTVYSDFSSTNTNEKYLAYSGSAPASTDALVVVGRFAATLSASGTGHLWTVPTYTNSNLVQRPIFETRILQYNPTFGGFSVSPSVTARYQFSGYNCWVNFWKPTSGGTSNATTFTANAPFNCGLASGEYMMGLWSQAQNNSVDLTTPGTVFIQGASKTITLVRDTAATAWTNTNVKYANFRLDYTL